jgi:hypothetical protein
VHLRELVLVLLVARVEQVLALRKALEAQGLDLALEPELDLAQETVGKNQGVALAQEAVGKSQELALALELSAHAAFAFWALPVNSRFILSSKRVFQTSLRTASLRQHLFKFRKVALTSCSSPFEY